MEWQHRRDLFYLDRRVAKHFRSPTEAGSRWVLERSSLQVAVQNILQACSPPNTILRVSHIVRQTARDTNQCMSWLRPSSFFTFR